MLVHTLGEVCLFSLFLQQPTISWTIYDLPCGSDVRTSPFSSFLFCLWCIISPPFSSYEILLKSHFVQVFDMSIYGISEIHDSFNRIYSALHTHPYSWNKKWLFHFLILLSNLSQYIRDHHFPWRVILILICLYSQFSPCKTNWALFDPGYVLAFSLLHNLLYAFLKLILNVYYYKNICLSERN